MATILAIDPMRPRPTRLEIEGTEVQLERDTESALARAEERVFDLLVLAGMPVDEQGAVASRMQERRSWRVVPVLYLVPPDIPGLIVPPTFRPELDGFARGPLESPQVQRRVRELAREDVSSDGVVVAGPYELDRWSGTLRFPNATVELTSREAQVLGLLLEAPNQLVPADSIIERAWGRSSSGEPDTQIVRRHVSNLRKKLEAVPGAPRIDTSRGAGYRAVLAAGGTSKGVRRS